MADKEFGRVCQKCKNKGGDTFARTYYEPIDGKWLRLCRVCWVAVEHGVQSDLGWKCAVCESTNLASDLECGYCDTPRPSR